VGLRAVELFHEAGVPKDVLHLLSGPGESVGAALVNDVRIDGICFTGSNETAGLINRNLAERDGTIVPLIAETGGQNAMIVDSSALLEATVADVLMSAFGSAGQRCSALRVLYIQEDVADEFCDLLKGAMDELNVDDPALLSTDVGPVIDAEALNNLTSHIERMKKEATLLAALDAPGDGNFVAPHAFEVSSIGDIGREVFGPVLHVIRYKASALDAVIDEINSTGFGLTCGVQSRIESKTLYVQSRIKAGNCYINRNMTGAVVGVQPFGGEGLSGTGPKAGGPHYLLRFTTKDDEGRPLDLNGQNTLGIDLSDEKQVQAIKEQSLSIKLPKPADAGKLDQLVSRAATEQETWSKTDASQRAQILRRVADRFESDKLALISKIAENAGGDVKDAVKEVGETIASLRYYANICEAQFARPDVLPGPTGEHNELQLHGRGTLACLTGEGENLSAFTAQISAALMAGNSVIAIISDSVMNLAGHLLDALYEEGVPKDVLVLLDQTAEDQLVMHAGIQGVCFVGGAEKAKLLNRMLSSRDGALLPLITEIGNSHYIHRLVAERTLTVNITAAGGNASLLTLDENV
jgi:RHH-type proline utilization regulon transcriptional repressor/proline dehydrogenase/delta 1-pyrroline-5-carboxylate dehydrogenase